VLLRALPGFSPVLSRLRPGHLRLISLFENATVIERCRRQAGRGPICQVSLLSQSRPGAGDDGFYHARATGRTLDG